MPIQLSSLIAPPGLLCLHSDGIVVRRFTSVIRISILPSKLRIGILCPASNLDMGNVAE